MPDVGDRESADKARAFGRDVGVNVVANLIAAMIIYLLGALAGILPKSQVLIGISAVVVGFAGFIGLLAVRRLASGWRRIRVMGASCLALGASLTASVFVTPPANPIETAFQAALGGVLVLTGAVVLVVASDDVSK